MVTPEALETFIKSIPPQPSILKQTMRYIDEGELIRAAKTAQEDLALSSYLRSFVNKPLFGFQKEVKDISQIFGILGLGQSKELLHHYMMSLFSPKQWKLFKLNAERFNELQISLSRYWKLLMDKEKIQDKDIISIISLLPSALIVTEMLFASHIKEVQLLRETRNLDYNTILGRVVGVDLFDIAQMIGEMWQMDERAIKVLKASSGTKSCDVNNKLCTCARHMHMLLFYILSQPQFLEAGLNDFLDFNPEFAMPVMELFQETVGLE